ncbi:MAG: hypothetical protein L3J53_03045 [Proteobacteria bacterium]|nr:hypothetical protein [Pseudomonadota bacterium]
MKILFILLSFNLYAIDFVEVERSLSTGDKVKAEQWLAQIDKSSTDYNKVDYIKARIALQANKLDDAEGYLDKAIKNYPHADTYNLAGGIYGMQAQDASIFFKLGYAKKSKKYLQKAHEADPTNIVYMESLIQFNIQAPGIAGGDSDAVEPLLKKIEKLDNTKAVNLRAQFLAKEEDEATALAYLNKEIAMEPANMDYHLYKGFLLSSMDKPDHAVAVYKVIVASDDSITKYQKSSPHIP